MLLVSTLAAAVAALLLRSFLARTGLGRSRVDEIDPTPRRHLGNWLVRPFSLTAALAARRPERFCPDAPDFEPGIWDRHRSRCYAYAVDVCPPEDCEVYTYPGCTAQRNGKAIRPGWTVHTVDRALRADGLVRATLRTTLCGTPERRWLVAVVSDPRSRDFHFYRLDRDGSWSHKPGTLPVSRVDLAGRKLRSPLRAASFERYWLVGFYWVYETCDVVQMEQTALRLLESTHRATA